MRRNRKRDRHSTRSEPVERYRGRLPAVGGRHGLLEHALPLAAFLDFDQECDWTLLDGAHGEVEPRPRGEVDLETRALGRAGHEGLAVDIAEALPAHSRRDALEMLLPEDESNGLDLEFRASLIQRAEENVARG